MDQQSLDSDYPVGHIASERGYRITFHGFDRGTGDVLMVCFGGSPDGLADFGFGAHWARKQGYDYVCVAQRRHSQYQDLSLEVFRDHLLPLCKGRRVFTYGISLGGYAALYYGGAIGARIIAVSPRNSIDPALLALGTEWRDQMDYDQRWKHRPMAEVPCSPHRPLVIFDPMVDDDRIYLQRVLRPPYGPRMRLLALPFAGHGLTRTLNEQGKLSQLLKVHVERDRIIDVISGTRFSHPEEPGAERQAGKPDDGAEKEKAKGISRLRPRPRRAVRRLRHALRRLWDSIAPVPGQPERMPPPAAASGFATGAEPAGDRPGRKEGGKPHAGPPGPRK